MTLPRRLPNRDASCSATSPGRTGALDTSAPGLQSRAWAATVVEVLHAVPQPMQRRTRSSCMGRPDEGAHAQRFEPALGRQRHETPEQRAGSELRAVLGNARGLDDRPAKMLQARGFQRPPCANSAAHPGNVLIHDASAPRPRPRRSTRAATAVATARRAEQASAVGAARMASKSRLWNCAAARPCCPIASLKSRSAPAPAAETSCRMMPSTAAGSCWSPGSGSASLRTWPALSRAWPWRATAVRAAAARAATRSQVCPA